MAQKSCDGIEIGGKQTETASRIVSAVNLTTSENFPVSVLGDWCVQGCARKHGRSHSKGRLL
jgi:hypothetical protein